MCSGCHQGLIRVVRTTLDLVVLLSLFIESNFRHDSGSKLRENLRDTISDVGHLNLHKTFSIPHGDGGPGVGTIGYKNHLAPFVPGHCEVPINGLTEGAIAGAPYGNAGVLPISYAYIKMSGKSGMLAASQQSILNANYMANKLDGPFKVLYRGKEGRCAHEFILDCNEFKKHGITEEDIAKRLIDYGFHAPTMSWPVVGGLMIEPTESEDVNELDRFIWAMLSVREEILGFHSVLMLNGLFRHSHELPFLELLEEILLLDMVI